MFKSSLVLKIEIHVHTARLKILSIALDLLSHAVRYYFGKKELLEKYDKKEKDSAFIRPRT